MTLCFSPRFVHPSFLFTVAAALTLGSSGCQKKALERPLMESETYSPAPVLVWNAEHGPRFEVLVARDAELRDVVLRDMTPVPRYVAPNGLGAGAYYWQASADGHAVARGLLNVRIAERAYEVPLGADAEAIRAVVAEAAKNPPARVVFPEKGEYRLDAGKILLDLKGARQLVVDGRGTKITFTSPMTGFARLIECVDVAFQDLVIEHDPKPFSVGRITSVNRQTGEIALQVEPGHPDFDAPHMLANWSFCMFLEPEPRGRILDDSPLVPFLNKDTLRRTDNGFVVTASQPSFVRLVEAGDRVVQFAREGGQSLFHVERSPDIVFLRIVNHSVSGGHYLMLECDSARILGCSSFPTQGFGYGANADGAHIRSSTIGPWIENCYFEAVGDDGVAIFAKGIEVRGQPSPGQVLLDEKFFNLKTGDELMFFNPREGLPVGGTHRIMSMEKVPAADGKAAACLVTLDPAPSVDMVFSFPDAWNNDQAFNMTARHGGFVVRRNTFHDIRRYGVIARADAGAIEDNVFVGTSDSAITLQNEPNVWRNGLHSTGVRIAGNRIDRCNFSSSARGRGAVHVVLRAVADVNQRWGDKVAAWHGHRDLTIVDNTISNWRGCAMSLQNIDGLVLERNRILDQRPSASGMPTPQAIFLDRVNGARVADNQFGGLQPGTPEIVRGGNISPGGP
jgi:hypothetical protein